MSIRPEPGTYVIFTAQGNNMCLGLDTSKTPPGLVLRKYSPDANLAGLTWHMWPIAGTHMFYLEHVGTGIFPHFGGADKEQLPVGTLDPNDREYVLAVDDKGDGYCAIQNHNLSRVFDCKEDSNDDGTPIIVYWWKTASDATHANQMWRFVPIGALEPMPILINDLNPRLWFDHDPQTGVERWYYWARDPRMSEEGEWLPLSPHRLLDVFTTSQVSLTLSVRATGIENPEVTATPFGGLLPIKGNNQSDSSTWVLHLQASLDPGGSQSFSISVTWPDPTARRGRVHRSDPTFIISRNG